MPIDMAVVQGLGDELRRQLVVDRRDLHRHPELGWTEVRTASIVARRLLDAGWQVALGRQVHADESRMGVPDAAELAASYRRALQQGADPELAPALADGFTGVVGTLTVGEGPIVGVRVDMDALPIQEAATEDHRPHREGFASINPGVMHACGHDAHTAVGMALAQALPRLRGQLQGTIKLIFQPAEEGVRGARSMVDAGVVDDLDHVVGFHFSTGWRRSEMIAGNGGWAATRKFDVRFVGRSAHAGGSPQQGHNALLAAAIATQGLYAIPRHSEGATRVNVGRLVAGTGRNIIPPEADMMVETRGATEELSEYMFRRALAVIEGAALTQGCTWTVREMGGAQSAWSDAALAERVRQAAQRLGPMTIHEPEPRGGSEDFTYMMRRVQARGGLATSISLGADPLGIGRDDPDRERVLGGHTPFHDLDEEALPFAVELLLMLLGDLLDP
jgi:aminobenzoyl-glutamate utilization protein A